MISLWIMLLTVAIVGVGLFFIFKMNTNPELKKARTSAHGRQLFKHHKKEKREKR